MKTTFCLLLTFFSLNTYAGEGMFNRVYTSETVEHGHYELEQLFRSRTGRAFGSYSALDMKTEVEYGVTDQFQAGLYFTSGYLHAQDAPDDEEPTGFSRNLWTIQSIAFEFAYRIFDPEKDAVGFAFYLEPQWLMHDYRNALTYDKSFETEFRFVVDKNLLEERLILAYNMVTELEFARLENQTDYKGKLSWNHEIGATYRFVEGWYAGLEGRNHNEIGNFNKHEHSTIAVGPSIHYVKPKFWTTLGVMKQVYGAPDGIENGALVGNNLFLRSHENYEITLKFAVTI